MTTQAMCPTIRTPFAYENASERQKVELETTRICQELEAEVMKQLYGGITETSKQVNRISISSIFNFLNK